MTVSAPYSGTVKVNGIDIYYEIHGSGEPVLLIEGLGYSSWMWYKQIPALSRKYQVVLFDNRGAGNTDKPDSEYTIEIMADDAAGLARTQLVPPGPAGALEVSAHFAGDAEYAASSVSAPSQLERAPTLLRLEGPTLLATDVAQPLIARLTLHAARITFEHPGGGGPVTFEAPTPKDLRATITQLARA